MRQTLGQKLRFLRLSRKYTQQEISGYLHLERAAYANYESDRRCPSCQSIVVIADFYGVPADYLIREELPDNSDSASLVLEQVLKDFCLLEPEKQKIIAQYLHRCAKNKV